MTEIIEITNPKYLPKGVYRMYDENPCKFLPDPPDKFYCLKHIFKKNKETYYVPVQKDAPNEPR